MELYAQAYQMVSQVDASSDALLEERSRLQMACLINKAQAASTLGLYQEAFSCCSLALEIDPRNVRAYHRRAVALQGMREFQAARQDLEAVLYLDPAHRDAAQMLQALPVAAVDEAGMEDDTTSVSRSNSVGSERGARTAARGKKDPGIAGLKNEGATCYLNAVVQALHHLPDLRAAIYSVPTQAPARGEAPSVALAMQHLFWRLQSVRKSQSTRELLASFGWDSADALQQQDISDFCHMLFDIVEEGMKNTTADGAIPRLLGVKLQYTDAAESVGWQKHRLDTSYVTVLHGVKDGECKNVMESIELLCKPQVIEDYDTEVHGKQTVTRTLAFKEAPPILLLNINRIDFDYETFEPIKLNDRYEFPEHLDLASVMVRDGAEDSRDDAEQGARAAAAASSAYSLRAVIVHMGTAQMGHYISYCKIRRPASNTSDAGGPLVAESNETNSVLADAGGEGAAGAEQAEAEAEEDAGMQWYCFDDDLVYPVSREEAVDGNFGSGECATGAGSAGGGGMFPTRGMIARMKASRSAYMLAYVRDDWLSPAHHAELEQALQGVPAHVRDAADAPGVRSLPVGVSLLVPPPGDGVSPAEACSNQTEGNAALVRGCPVDVSVTDLETRSVGDLLDLVEETNAALLTRPSPAAFLGGEVVRTAAPSGAAEAAPAGVAAAPQGPGSGGQDAVGEPQIGLALTAVGKHMVVQIYRNNTAAALIDRSFLLRADWVDTQAAARHVPVMHLELVADAPDAAREQGEGDAETDEGQVEVEATGGRGQEEGQQTGDGGVAEAEGGADGMAAEGDAGAGASKDSAGTEEKQAGGSGETESGQQAVAYKPFGDPFVWSLYLGETVGSARRRLASLLKLPDKDIELAWCSWNRLPFRMQNDEDELLPDERLLQRHWLGVVHKDDGNGPGPLDFWSAVNAQAGSSAKSASGVKLR